VTGNSSWLMDEWVSEVGRRAGGEGLNQSEGDKAGTWSITFPFEEKANKLE
jgi:hypothetical protein